MQTASTNICERLCNKSIHEISLLLNIPQSIVSGVITKWKQLGTTATQPRSDRAGSAYAEAHSAQKLPTVCRVNS
ncbi:unnamed protein product [Staurois parvus]|uniref:Uncharacterized protein n=1 Tax=Staurois parvus TaxID=386267 RepID=A0ABN9G0H6_9NEOB|nr:unnamed protein product [Staurois parvus]